MASSIICGGQYLSIGEVAERVGLSIQTVRNYSKRGLIPAYRLNGSKGHRRYRIDEIERFFNGEMKCEQLGGGNRVIIYARISDGKRSKGFGKGEQSDLQRQVDRLKAYAELHYPGITPLVLAETGSGLSFQRKQFNRLIDGLLNKSFEGAHILLTHPERLCRIGRELVEKLVTFSNSKLIYTEQEELEEDESPGVLIAEFCSSVVSRIYANRYAKRALKKVSDHALERIRYYRDLGLPVSRIVDELHKEQIRTEDGAGISISVTKRLLAESLILENTDGKSSIELYCQECIEKAHDSRITKAKVYNHYLKWAKSRGITPCSRNQASRLLRGAGLQETKIASEDGSPQIIWLGIRIKGEKLHFTVAERKPRGKYRKNTEAANSFLEFYRAELKGKFSGYRREIDRLYLSWLEQNGKKKVSLRDIPKLLMSEAGAFPEFRKKGFIYHL